MISLIGRKLRIYAMLLRLEEIKQEHRKRALLLNKRPEQIMIINEVRPLVEYFEPKKLHPKHQNQNKYRFNK